MLEEIVVSAEPLRPSRQEAYVSAAVLDGEDLQALGVLDLRDSLRLVPNVNSAPSNNGNNGISIRGLNSEGVGQAGGGGQPLSVLVVDGAQQSLEGLRRGTRGLWDVAQLEILRGPQSTVQGRNALAGAIVVETRDPGQDWEARIRMRADTNDNADLGFVLSGPVLGEQLGFRIAGQQLEENANIDYADPRLAFLGDGRFRSLRAKLKFTPGAIPGLDATFSTWLTEDTPAVTAVSGPDFFARELDQPPEAVDKRTGQIASHALRLRYTLTDDLRLESTTALIRTDTTISSPPPIRRDESRDDQDLTQDVRLLFGQQEAGGLSGAVGLYAARFHNERDSVVTIQGFGGQTATIQNLASRREITNLAVFGDVRWDLGARWSLLASARYLYDDDEARFLNRINGQAAESRATDRRLLPRGGIAYRIADNQRLALTVATGYRSGFGEQVAGENREVDPEILTSYELAYRSEWSDSRLLVNGNLFVYDWQDQQVTVQDPFIPGLVRVENAGRSAARGAELEVTAAPVDTLEVSLALAFLQTEFQDFATSVGDYAGNEFPEAPGWSGVLRVSWNPGERWFVNADVSYQDESFATADLRNQARLIVPGRTLVNAGIGLRTRLGTVQLRAENLLDEAYLTGRDLFDGAYVGPPRALALIVDLGFGGG